MAKKKDKLKTDLEDAIFKFEDKKEEIGEYLDQNNGGVRRFNVGVVETTLNELSRRWESVGSSFMSYSRSVDDDEDRAELNEFKQKYNACRKVYTESQTKVRDAVDLQNIADMNAHPPDTAGKIEELKMLLDLNREAVREEINSVETYVEGLSDSLTTDAVINHRLIIDKALEELEARVREPVEELMKLDPNEKENVRKEHVDFCKEQRAKLLASLGKLLGKQKTHPVVAPNTSASTLNQSPRGLQLEKMKIPTYCGDPTKWLLFKDKFKDLVSNAGYDDLAQGHVLRDVVPKEAQNRVEHLKSATEMFTILDQMYGDPATSVSIIVNKLLHLRLAKSVDFEKVIELATTVDKYSCILKSLSTDAIQHIKYNTNILTHLVSLLPKTYEDKWYDFCLENSEGASSWDRFTEWLQDMEKRANLQRLARLNATGWRQEPCAKCKSSSHATSEHMDKSGRVSSHATNITTAPPPASICPVCRIFHERGGQRGNLIIDCPKWKELNSVDERARLVETMKGCRRCLRWDHEAGEECLSPKGFYLVRDRINKYGSFNCGKTLANGRRCTGDHSIHLCGTTVQYCCAVELESPVAPVRGSEEVVLLPVQLACVMGEPTRIFWDDGSTGAMITYRKASSLGLHGRDVMYEMQTVNNDWKIVHGHLFDLDLVDNDGDVHPVNLYGVEKIADIVHEVEVAGALKEMMPEVPEDAWIRPKGEIDILIGSNFTNLMPKDKYEVGNLRVKSSIFGEGFCLQGSSPLVKKTGLVANSISQREDVKHAPGVQGFEIQIMRVQICPSPLPQPLPGLRPKLAKQQTWEECEQVAQEEITPEVPAGPPAARIDEDSSGSTGGTPPGSPVPACIFCGSLVERIPFLEAEEDGVGPPRRCPRCKSCESCSDRNRLHSEAENAQLEVIESKVHVNPECGETRVEYPFTEDPLIFGNKDDNNRSQAIAVQRSVESRIIKKNLVEEYNSEFNKFLERGTLVEVTDSELASWSGGVNFLSHHEVLKPGSESTPCRIVTNSALVNSRCKKSLNQVLLKGPNCLNSLTEVLIRYRSYEVGLLFDLKKAYNSLLTGPVEKFARLVVWRNCDRTKDWRTYGYRCVAFGDQSAACQLEVAKSKCADLGKSFDAIACERIKNDTYVDDGVTGGSREEVERFRGNRDDSSSGTIAKILGIGGLQIKAMRISGEEGGDELGGQVLGITYDSPSDRFVFKAEVQAHTKKRGIRSGPAINEDTLHLLDDIRWTPRMMVGTVNSFFDPLGLMSPWNLKFKLILRKLTELPQRLGWDDLIPVDLELEWKELIQKTIDLGTVTFPRSFHPLQSFSSLSLVGFFDGSLTAWGCLVYARYELPNNEVHVAIIAAKSRVAPSKGTSIPKAELNGLLDLSRLLLTVTKSLTVKPDEVHLLGDSECAIALTAKSGSSLSPYFCNRVAEYRANVDEISKVCQVRPPFHIPGPTNPSDILTRGQAEPDLFKEGGYWKGGPMFLKLPSEMWPTKSEVSMELPEEINRVKVISCKVELRLGLQLTPKQLLLVINCLSYSDDLNKVLGVIARLLQGWKLSRESILSPLSPQILEEAWDCVVKVSQLKLKNQDRLGKYKSLLPELTEDGKIVVTGRLGRGMKEVLGHEPLPLLEKGSRFAELIMWKSHREMHRATPAETAARSRKYAWVTRARQLATSVCKRCPLCRLIHVRLGKQIMGDRRVEHLKCEPPFTNVACDLFGPFKVRSMTNHRSQMKTWGVIYICQGTGAVRGYLTGGYDTKSFLTAHEKFVAHCGNPKTITSDQGSQLRLAAKTLEYSPQEDPQNWAWEEIREMEARRGTEWVFIPPGSQWRNRAEAAVKVMKSTLSLTIRSQEKLNFAELEALIMSASNIMNERPLAVRVFDESDFQPLTVNQLLLGRTKTSLGSMDYQEVSNRLERLAFKEELEKVWWEQFVVQVLPTLVPVAKWKDKYPNRREGDIVLVVYPGMKKADYRMGRVESVKVDPRGNVRTMKVEMRRRDKRTDGKPVYKGGEKEVLELPVQRTALIMPVDEYGSLGEEKQIQAALNLKDYSLYSDNKETIKDFKK